MISEAAIQFGMQEALQQLGIKEINEGTSTGTKWFSNGKISNHIHQQQEI